MSPEQNTKTTKLCPTCGTRLSEDAARCLVCGTELATTDKPSKPAKAVQGSRLPEITLNLPAVLGLFILFIAIGAGLVYYAMRQTTPDTIPPTETPTITITPSPTITTTPQPPTATNTPVPTPTPLSYKVASGDTCSSIAFAFGVSTQSIILLNSLPAACDNLIIGQNLLIPHPTPTSTPQPTATMNAEESTRVACGEFEYTVQENDTLSSISANYAVAIVVLKEYNGLVNDTVRSGQVIKIPLCQRAATAGPSPTPTLPPPYAAPSLLLPQDGAPFTGTDDTVTLQWASVGTLRDNEAYAVTIVDVTGGQDRKLVDYVVDTKYNVPLSFRPTDNLPHVIRWWVLTARQVGTDDSGNPIWEPAGASSAQRDFIWVGVALAVTPTP
ncbi:MAG TPA: LysM peptidoglycan-binding domain-containing protein [Anaerolineales bacterium]